jgi:hypothetical protein
MATKKTKDSVDDELTDDTGDVENSDTIDDDIGDDIEFILDVPDKISDPEKWRASQNEKAKRLFAKRGKVIQELKHDKALLAEKLNLLEGSMQSEVQTKIEAMQYKIDALEKEGREATLRAYKLEALIAAGLTPEDAVFISGVDEETIDAQVTRLAERTQSTARESDNEDLPPAIKKRKHIGNPADIHGLTRKKLEQMSQAEVMELMNSDPDSLARALRNG